MQTGALFTSSCNMPPLPYKISQPELQKRRCIMKKNFTRIIALLLIPALLLTTFCGCSLPKGNRPFEQSLNRYITALSTGNYNLLKHITTSDSMIRTKIYDADEKEQENFQLLFKQIKLQNITNAEQYDNEITVIANIIHTDYGAMIEICGMCWQKK